MQPTLSTKAQKAKSIQRDWHLIDLSGKTLGRTATEVSYILQGKHKVDYSPHLDGGDYVVLVNAKDVKISGRKSQDKVYTRYSGYPGGLKKENFANLLHRRPEHVITLAVSGMLPKNKLRDKRLKRLFVYSDDKHPYQDKVKSAK